ncbi:protein of unassigned function [Methylobacterium oryzae CBMB20]|uniref:Protein of unassigned function n=1 Tax=Methylobacterium oryzae CBMB20 TaxID=693986 RepID=A0A089Q6M6_9HYPH|nr:protein of unassigned function [Methylobacterium oryzae CBMB20]
MPMGRSGEPGPPETPALQPIRVSASPLEPAPQRCHGRPPPRTRGAVGANAPEECLVISQTCPAFPGLVCQIRAS